METFVTRSLTKIGKAVKGNAKLKELRAACDAALEKLAAAKGDGRLGEDGWRRGVPVRAEYAGSSRF